LLWYKMIRHTHFSQLSNHCMTQIMETQAGQIGSLSETPKIKDQLSNAHLDSPAGWFYNCTRVKR
jgi:hypothetical protein